MKKNNNTGTSTTAKTGCSDERLTRRLCSLNAFTQALPCLILPVSIPKPAFTDEVCIDLKSRGNTIDLYLSINSPFLFVVFFVTGNNHAASGGVRCSRAGAHS